MNTQSDYRSYNIKIFAVALLLSGFAALTYQIIWQKILTQIIGSDAVSMTLVVSIFMICLGIGAEISRRLVRQSLKRALVTYAIIEILVAAYGFFSVQFLRGVNKEIVVFIGDHLISDFLFNLFILSFPIVGMGITTPLIVHVAKQYLNNAGRMVGLLYGCNIAGAAVGAAITGLVLIEAFGLDTTAKIAAILNIFSASIALTALVIFKAQPARSTIEAKANPSTKIALHTAVSAILFGFSTLAIQAVYFRILSNYLTLIPIVFPMMLCAYLCLMALGQWLGGQLADRFSERLTTVITALFFAGAALLVLTLHFPSSWAAAMRALRFNSAAQWSIEQEYPYLIGDPSPLVVLIFSLIIMLAVVPWSGIFPIMFRLITSRIEEAGHSFARIYSLYALGNVIGVFVCGLFLLAFVGTENSVRIIILICAIGVLSLLINKNQKLISLPTKLIWLSGICIVLFVPKDYYKKSFEIGNYSIYEVFEGRMGVVTAAPRSRHTFQTSLDMNRTSSAAAMNSYPKPEDRYEAWRWNHSELMSFDNSFRPRNVLILGMGNAWLIHTLLDYEFIEKITVVDISSEIVEAVKKYTTISTSSIFDDPRVEIIIADGRRYIQSARNKQLKFDLIQNSINAPWHAGSSSLYTIESFAEQKSLLSPGGYLSIRPLTGLLNDSLKVFSKAIIFRRQTGGMTYHMYLKNEDISIPEAAIITPDICRGWFAEVPGRGVGSCTNEVLNSDLQVVVFNDVLEEMMTDTNTDNHPTFEYYFLRKALGKWISPRTNVRSFDLNKYERSIPVSFE